MSPRCFFLLFAVFSLGCGPQTDLHGPLRVWQTLTLDFHGRFVTVETLESEQTQALSISPSVEFPATDGRSFLIVRLDPV